MSEKDLYSLLFEFLAQKQRIDRSSLNQLKREISEHFKIPFPSNIDLLKTYHKLLEEKRVKRSLRLESLLRTRPVRSLSGIVNVTVLTKPFPCPGRCLFCPSEKGFPKSYLEGEPAASRARLLNFHPFLQTQKRIQMLKEQGHFTDKIELRVVGGTWSFYPQQYQAWFIKSCLEAGNQKKSSSLLKAQRINERAKNRIVGLSVETRPDFINPKEILRLRRLGVTMVELGVPSVFDPVLKRCQTHLTRQKIIRATRLLKDSGFKVLYQTMVNLPGSTPQLDLDCFKTIFRDQDFKPDWLKIYPCLVCQTAPLYRVWKKGGYQPYGDQELIGLLVKIKRGLPFWVRVARIFRDIPGPKIIAGSQLLNLRERIKEKMQKQGLFCACIRCREIKEDFRPKEKLWLFRQDYQASGSQEIFLTWENKTRTRLYSLLRLRIPSVPEHFLTVLKAAGLIRELQTFGPVRPLRFDSKNLTGPWAQHKGLAKKLIKEAETISSQEFGLKKMAIIAGVGSRGFYRKLGYRLKDTYMVKSLRKWYNLSDFELRNLIPTTKAS